MTLFVIILIAALVFGGIGLVVEAAAWALLIALALVVVGVVFGVMTLRGAGRRVPR